VKRAASDLLTLPVERTMPDMALFSRSNQYFLVAGGHGTREKQLT
jgi:hypothetical protein